MRVGQRGHTFTWTSVCTSIGWAEKKGSR